MSVTETQETAPEEAVPQAAHEEEASLRRRMPANLKRHLLKMQGGKMYLPAAFRLVWFRDECPLWGVWTEIVEGGQEAGLATVKASILTEDGRIVAMAHKTETRQDFPAGWVEKAETGAVARALAMLGFGTQFSDDLLDEAETRRPADSPVGGRSGFGERTQRSERPSGRAVAEAAYRRQEPAETTAGSPEQAAWTAALDEWLVPDDMEYRYALMTRLLTRAYKAIDRTHPGVRVNPRTKLEGGHYKMLLDALPAYVKRVRSEGIELGEEFARENGE